MSSMFLYVYIYTILPIYTNTCIHTTTNRQYLLKVGEHQVQQRIAAFGWICPRTVIHCHPVLSSWPTCRVPPEAEVGPSMWLEAWPDAVRWECSSEVPARNVSANGCRSKAFRDNCTSAQEESDSRSARSPKTPKAHPVRSPEPIVEWTLQMFIWV